MFYRSVVQAVLLFGEETWVLSSEMTKTLEGFHVGFLSQVMGNTAKIQQKWTWRRYAEESVLKEEGTQRLGTYIDKTQAVVVEWVALRLIDEV